MTSPNTDLRAELEADFGRARERLVEARLRRQVKDTPRHRAAIAACQAEIDMVLDLYLVMVAVPTALPSAAFVRRGSEAQNHGVGDSVRPSDRHGCGPEPLPEACMSAPRYASDVT